MKRILLASCCIVLAFVACGKTPTVCDPDALMQKAQLCVFPADLNFSQDVGGATYLGTRPINTFILRNGGVEDLVLTSVIANGDGEFKYTANWDTDLSDTAIPTTTLKGNKTAVIQVEFAPRAARRYQGTINIVSNAQNTPDKLLAVSGCGLPADGGTSPCYRDGGTP